MNADFISSLAGILLSLLASYVPGVRQWYAGLDADHKRLVMLGALVVTAVGVYGLACSGYGQAFGVPVACNERGAVEVIRAFVAALVANQATYLVTPGGDK